MARGMVNGEPIVSQANSEDFEKGYARTFPDAKVVRGRWIWDAEAGKLVPADEYRAPESEGRVEIMAGRFYENTCTTDGVDIGSRAKRKRYMAEHGLADSSDYKNHWQEAPKRRAEEHKRDVSTDVDNVVRELHQRRR